MTHKEIWEKNILDIQLTTDELLTTTRSVRRRLDLTRPVERDVIDECTILVLLEQV